LEVSFIVQITATITELLVACQLQKEITLMTEVY